MTEVGAVKLKTNFYNWFIVPTIFVILGLLGYIIYRQAKENDITKTALQNELKKETLLRSNCGYLKDSLIKLTNDLSKFKTLTMAMVHRDEATKQLKYEVGDIVLLKNDSSRVVIEDVLIGGGKYNYYVKYRVLLKDNTTREIVPELIY